MTLEPTKPKRTRQFACAKPLHTFPPRLRDAVLATAWFYRVPATLILSRARTPGVIAARWAAMRMCRSLIRADGTNWSYPAIGRLFGVDHTSVMNAMRGDIQALLDQQAARDARRLEAKRRARRRNAERARLWGVENRALVRARANAKYRARKADEAVGIA